MSASQPSGGRVEHCWTRTESMCTAAPWEFRAAGGFVPSLSELFDGDKLNAVATASAATGC